VSLLTLFNQASSAETSDDVWLKALAGTDDVEFTADGGVTTVVWADALSGTDTALIALIRDVPNDTVELYVNGVSKGQQAYSVDFSGTTHELVLGGGSSGEDEGLITVGPFAAYYARILAMDQRAVAKTALAGRVG
jgi:hypothetical protein